MSVTQQRANGGHGRCWKHELVQVDGALKRKWLKAAATTRYLKFFQDSLIDCCQRFSESLQRRGVVIVQDLGLPIGETPGGAL